MALGDSSFQRYLAALNAEYERLATENNELRRELHKDPLWKLRRSSTDSNPPPQPILAYAATPSTSVPGELPADPLWQIRGEDCEIIEPVKAITAYELDDYAEKRDKSPSGKSVPPGSPKKMSVRDYKRQNSRWIDDEESEDSPTFLLMLDVIPAVVIMLSAAVAGLSADIHPESPIWQAFEIFFTVFFVGEICVKLRVFGVREYLVGKDWYWSWFDILCVVLALVDLAVTYGTMDSAASDSGSLSSLKMLKLARLGRIIRLLKFKIFQELKLMIQGVFTGLRVLTWAVILLVTSMYLLGVITRTFFDQYDEFSTVPAAMFTSFRCVTDGCTAYDGTPLQEKLRRDSDMGGVLMMMYILLFLFVTIGIFNLIMAVFIDNVTDGSTKKRQRQLGANAPKTEWLISSVLRNIILTKILHKEAEEEMMNGDYHTHGRRPSKILKEKLGALQEMYGYKPHTVHEYEQLTNKIRKEMATRNVVVTREEFNHWLSGEKELITTLDDSEIDLSCKSDLFDVLDADLSGELEFEEMIDGLLKCRGPASKTDIIEHGLISYNVARDHGHSLAAGTPFRAPSGGGGVEPIHTYVSMCSPKSSGNCSESLNLCPFAIPMPPSTCRYPSSNEHERRLTTISHRHNAVQLVMSQPDDVGSLAIVVRGAFCKSHDSGAGNRAQNKSQSHPVLLKAVQLLADLGEDRLETNIIMQSAAITACEKGGAWQTALRLLRDLNQTRISPDVIMYNATMSACEKGEQWAQALSLLLDLRVSQLEADVISYNSVISACGKGENWQKAVGLLRDLQQLRLQATIITYNAVISAFGQGHEWQRAVGLLQDLQEQRLEASIVTFSAVISACEEGGQWAHALQVLEDVGSSRLEANIVAYNAAVSACGIAGQWEQSLAFLDLLPKRSLQPDIYTYSAAISAFGDGERWDPQWEQALHLLDELRLAKLLPNIVTFGAAITACEKGGQWQAALCLLEDLASHRIPLNTLTCNAAISACEKGRQWQLALGLLHDIHQRGYQADVISFSAVIRAIRACEDETLWGQALCLFEEMRRQQLPANSITFYETIGACVKSLQFGQAVRLLEDGQFYALALPLKSGGKNEPGEAQYDDQFAAQFPPSSMQFWLIRTDYQLFMCNLALTSPLWKGALKASLLTSSGFEGQQGESSEAGECPGHICSDGWVPKTDHHELQGSNDPQCCVKTCALWTCSAGYVADARYAGNVGSSNEQCCDKTCKGFSCPAHFKVPIEKSQEAGITTEECCAPTCFNVTCMPNYVKVKANVDKLFPKDEEQSFCCEATCATHTCDESQGMAVDPKKLHLTDVSDEKCCSATCAAFTCPEGYAVPSAKEKVVGNSQEECCQPLCSAHKCSAGWKPDPVKVTALKHSDEACCQKTCSKYECGEGWTKKAGTDDFVGVDDETCCVKTCSQYQDKCTGDYAPNPDVNKTAGSTAEICCKKTCGLYSCSTGKLKPNAQEIIDATDGACCEHAACSDFRKKTLVEGGCNQLDTEEKCAASKLALKNVDTNKTDELACYWKALSRKTALCMVGPAKPSSCSD
ncbi:unnamed protein product [Symbiodinium natans]|uniref:Ion transport domain-containing protein n=1 Tax=Symbiodinium natans TaxID=878477 RepID=A0A812TXN6_9DINO|nr:unnamed protein product [Symbiodinium natans]